MTHRSFTCTYKVDEVCTQTCNCVCIQAELCHRRTVSLSENQTSFFFWVTIYNVNAKMNRNTKRYWRANFDFAITMHTIYIKKKATCLA